MKKVIILFLCFLMTGCGFVPSITGIESKPPLIKAFEYSKKCPFVCWLGINPGTTTAAQAIAFVRTSNQFDQDSTYVFENHVHTIWYWYPRKTNDNLCVVDLDFTNSLVGSINFNCTPAVKVEDLINFLGTPDEVISDGYLVAECALFNYSILYHSQKTLIEVSNCPTFDDWRNISWKGPDPSDYPDSILLLSIR